MELTDVQNETVETFALDYIHKDADIYSVERDEDGTVHAVIEVLDDTRSNIGRIGILDGILDAVTVSTGCYLGVNYIEVRGKRHNVQYELIVTTSPRKHITR